jgi:hypothetical protein
MLKIHPPASSLAVGPLLPTNGTVGVHRQRWGVRLVPPARLPKAESRSSQP